MDMTIARLRGAFLLTAGFMAVEVAGGLLFNSVALLSDAAHMLMDAGALGIALAAAVLSKRSSDRKRTYGYRRVEVLGGLVNGGLLVALTAGIVWEAAGRFRTLPSVQGAGMTVVAAVGLGVNLLALSMLRGARHGGMNARAAFLHVMGDTLGSVAAILAGAGIWLFGWRILDPAASVLVALLVLAGSLRLIRESLHILLEGSPRRLSIDRVASEIARVDGVDGVHDVHVWTIGSGLDVLTVHVVSSEGVKWPRIRREVQRLAESRFGIRHVTVQVEESAAGGPCAPACNEHGGAGDGEDA